MATVLVPMDGSEQAEAALEHAIAEFPESDLVVLHVIDPSEPGFTAMPGSPGDMFYSEEWYERAQEEAEELFDRARETAGDVEVETVTEVGKTSRTILEYAEERGVDHIVIGSSGHTGVSRVLLGSVAERVVRRASVPVTVVR